MKKNYIDKAELREQWIKWRDSGDTTETRTIPDRLGELIFLISTRLLTKRQFIDYPQDVKDELAQEGCLKCIKSLKNINPDGNIFSYFTSACWSAFMNYLVKYYRNKNKQRQLLIEALEEAKANPETHTTEYMDELLRMLHERDDAYCGGETDEQ